MALGRRLTGARRPQDRATRGPFLQAGRGYLTVGTGDQMTEPMPEKAEDNHAA